MANSRIELTEKHPCCPSLLRGPFLRNVSTFFQPRGSLVRSPLFPWLSRECRRHATKRSSLSRKSVYSPDLFPPVARSSSWRVVSANPCFQKTGIAFSSTSSRPKFFGRPIDTFSDKELNSSILLHPCPTCLIV